MNIYTLRPDTVTHTELQFHAFRYKTLWSWFTTWDITKYNISAKDVHDVYNDADVLTLDELPDWRA